MKITRLLLTAFGLATTIAINACYCGVDDQHAVTISSLDSLTILSGGVTRRIGGAARLTDPPTNTTTLGFVYSTIEGSTGGEGISLSSAHTTSSSRIKQRRRSSSRRIRFRR